MARVQVIFLTLFLSVTAFGKARIAVLYPKTGPKSDFNCITRGVMGQAKSQGLDFSVDYYDSENEVLATARVAKKIVSKGYDIVIGTRTSQEAIAASGIFDQAKLPFVVPIASNPQVTVGKKYTLSLISDSYRYAAMMAQFAASDIKPKKVAVIVNASLPYSTFYADEFPKKLKEMRPETQFESFEIIKGFSKFDDLTNKILASNADLVYMPIYTIDALAVFHAFAKRQKSTTMLSHASMNDGRQLFKSNVTNIHPELYFNSVWNYQVEGPESVNYRKILSQSCPKNDDNLRTVSGYDVSTWVVRTLKSYPKARGLELVKHLRMATYTGLMGSLMFPKGSQSAKRPLQIFQVKNKEIKFFKTVEGK